MDKIDTERRSENMRRIRSKNTKPELLVRRLVWSLGFRGYRTHWKSVPGKPDLAWIRKKKAIFVHGCFWHGHACKGGARKPKTRADYWIAKITRNTERDRDQIEKLLANGWDVLVLWDCELQNKINIQKRLQQFLSDH